MAVGSGSKAKSQVTLPWGLNEYRVLLRMSKISSINSAEGLKVAVAKNQFLETCQSTVSSLCKWKETHNAPVAASSASEAREVISELLEMLGTAASSSYTAG